jgi:hypothetical protein
MLFVVATIVLLMLVAANAVAIATLVRSSWRTDLLLVQRRRRLCSAALYAVPLAVVAKQVALTQLSPGSGSSWGPAIMSALVAGLLPLLAHNKVKAVLERLELRELVGGRD